MVASSLDCMFLLSFHLLIILITPFQSHTLFLTEITADLSSPIGLPVSVVVAPATPAAIVWSACASHFIKNMPKSIERDKII